MNKRLRFILRETCGLSRTTSAIYEDRSEKSESNCNKRGHVKTSENYFGVKNMADRTSEEQVKHLEESI